MSSLASTLCRSGLGTVAGGLAGSTVFGLAILDPADRVFDCLIVSALLAGLVAFVRLGRLGQALMLALVFAALRSGLSPARGVRVVAAAVLLGLGALLVAVLFDLLARDGLRFGKFLVLGPLLGGVYLAIAPLDRFHDLGPSGAVDVVLFHLFLGLVIGDSVGLGLELAELVPGVIQPIGPPVPIPIERNEP